MKRRTLLKLTGTAPLIVLTDGHLIASETLQPLDRSNQAAKTLAYVDDAADADPERHQAGSRCDNCRHFQPDKAAAGTGGCALFPGFSVVATGWCAGWVADPEAD